MSDLIALSYKSKPSVNKLIKAQEIINHWFEYYMKDKCEHFDTEAHLKAIKGIWICFATKCDVTTCPLLKKII